MENKSKKSKAIIITIIAIIILLIIGYFLFKNKENIFGLETSGNLSKIFSPLDSSSNSKKVIAQAGEDIKKGDSLSASGTNVNNNPIVIKAGNNSDIFGFANEDILNGEMGEIIINTPGINNFWESISGFLENIFTPPDVSIPSPEIPVITPPEITFGYTPTCSDEKDNDGDNLIDIEDPNCHDANGNYLPLHYSEAISPIIIPIGEGYTPQCSDTIDNDTDTTIDEADTNCHNTAGTYLPRHYSEAISPIILPDGGYTPACSDEKDNDGDNLIDIEDPNCLNANGEYLPLHYSEAEMIIIIPPDGTYYPQCSDTKDNDTDTFIDEADPNCHVGGDLENGAYVPRHWSESNSPFSIPDGEEGAPDLIAGGINPMSAIVNTPTRLSSIITNIGDGKTGSNFPAYFAITKTSDSGDTTGTGGGDSVSKSGFKNIIAKIFNKIIPTEKVNAAVTTTSDTNTPGSNTSIELNVTVGSLPAGISSVVYVIHSFDGVGTYSIRACADKSSSTDSGTIIELNEENNCGPWTTFTVTKSLPTGGDSPECSDTIDNDGDSRIDFVDPNCHISGDISGEYVSSHDDEASSPTGGKSSGYQCSDGTDNDKDTKIDEADPNCHLDGDLAKEYIKTHDDERNSPITPVVNECLLIQNNPLTFTDAEKAELAQLLRKFYLIAPTLKTDEDISLVYSEITQYENFTEQLEGLTDECYAQQGLDENCTVYGNCPVFTLSPAKRYGNPWFKPELRGPDPITGMDRIYTDYNQFLETKEAVIDCKLVSGYYTGTTSKYESEGFPIPSVAGGQDCSKWNPVPSCSNQSDVRKDFIDPTFDAPTDLNDPLNIALLKAGCKWNPGTNFDKVEYLLNIW
ncbi:MAG: hypothetical protein WC603_01315 [Candidatus Paceibacterota bacterium]|jgi:hypothetical protein